MDDSCWPLVAGLDDRVAPAGLAQRAPDAIREGAVNPNLVGIVDGDLGLLPDPRPDGIADVRRAFVDMLNADGPLRAEAWHEAAAGLGHPGTLVVSVCNAVFLPFLGRWLSSCDRRSIEVRARTVIVALDAATVGRCQELGLVSVAANGEDRDDLASAAGWNDPRFA